MPQIQDLTKYSNKVSPKSIKSIDLSLLSKSQMRNLDQRETTEQLLIRKLKQKYIYSNPEFLIELR